LVEVLDAAKAVLLDFDGPVCDLFAGFPAWSVADAVRSALTALSAGEAHEGFGSSDPLEVMRAGAEQIGSEASAEILAQLESRAVQSATLTPGASECLAAFARAGKQVVVVSSNDARAIRAFLADNGLDGLVVRVVGRPVDDLATMKPHPRTLLEACEALSLAPAQAVMIGDSVADIEAARAAGCPSIGYANKPGKDRTLAAADTLVIDMHDVASAIR
jgi:HAD superfamily hydrolase (TIGR01509 family)